MKKIAFTFILAASILILGAGCASKQVEEEKTPASALELYKAGQADKARGLFNIGEDINATDEDGNTLLHICAAIDEGKLQF